MKDKQPSPADKTQVRITKDKRELQRLAKKAQKHLVEGHSPVIFDYANGQLSMASRNISQAEKTIDRGFDQSEFDGSAHITAADKAALDAVDLWGEEYRQIIRNIEQRNLEYFHSEEDEIDEDWRHAAEEANKRLQELLDDEGNLIREIDLDANYWYNQKYEDFMTFVDKDVPAEMDFWTAMMSLPGILIQALMGDFDHFIEYGLKLFDLQRELTRQIQEKIEGEVKEKE